jgi:N-acetylglucosamine kinase-like BadF-type ATPase/DNA-binding XRE family transcriptional regulator
MHNPEHLGRNIRSCRRARHLTQAALAAKLFVSPQNISKWENAQSSPDVANLCALADALGVSVDQLLGGETRENGRVMIGIDGGGTKTEFCLFNERGEILGRELLAGTNPNVYGMDKTQKTLKAGIDALMARNADVCGIFAGVAGCGIDRHRRAVTAFLKKTYPGVKIEVFNDTYNVIYSTPYHENCIMAIMGTGSVVCVKKGDTFARLGGWGYLFDRGCSGFDLGRDAVSAALADEDRVGEPTLITGMLREKIGMDGGVFDNIGTIYGASKEVIASYSRIVFDAYDKGDKVAGEILRENMENLLHLLRRAETLYNGGNLVILAGGLTNHREVLLHFLEKSGEFRFVFPDLPPILGACVYCMRMFEEPCETFIQSFTKDYEQIKGEDHAENGNEEPEHHAL